MPKEAEYTWERQPGESEQAYEAFCIYRDMGLQRTNQQVCEKLSKSRQLISRWKSQYDWDERVRAYDNDLQRQAHKEAIRELKEMTRRHTDIAKALQNKALLALKRMPVEELTPRDIKEYLKLATELERLNRTYAAQESAATEDDDMSDDDLGARVDIYMPEKEAEDDE